MDIKTIVIILAIAIAFIVPFGIVLYRGWRKHQAEKEIEEEAIREVELQRIIQITNDNKDVFNEAFEKFKKELKKEIEECEWKRLLGKV